MKNFKLMCIAGTITAALFLISPVNSFADKTQKEVADNGTPPIVSFDACEKKIENDECSFQHMGKEVTGTCQLKHDRLMCFPNDKTQQSTE